MPLLLPLRISPESPLPLGNAWAVPMTGNIHKPGNSRQMAKKHPTGRTNSRSHLLSLHFSVPRLPCFPQRPPGSLPYAPCLPQYRSGHRFSAPMPGLPMKLHGRSPRAGLRSHSVSIRSQCPIPAPLPQSAAGPASNCL